MLYHNAVMSRGKVVITGMNWGTKPEPNWHPPIEMPGNVSGGGWALPHSRGKGQGNNGRTRQLPRINNPEHTVLARQQASPLVAGMPAATAPTWGRAGCVVPQARW